MQLIDRLLTGVPEEELNSFRASAQLHLKQILTTISKHRLEDMTPTLKRRNQCLMGCYDYHTVTTDDPSLAHGQLQELRLCKSKCEDETRAVEQFLDNINFYSKKKLQGCSKGCLKLSGEEHFACLWECHNRLDRRYKQYWLN